MILAKWSQLARIINRADVVLEVVDARNPMATRSSRLEQMVKKKGKQLLIVLNKGDLVPIEILKAWTRYFKSQGIPAVYMAASKHMGTRELRKAITSLINKRPIIVAVIGYPKTGKSTIINALKGRSSASTSSIPGSPGYTKSFSMYRISENLRLIDTPGTIPIEGDELEKAIRGCPPEKLEDPVKLAAMLIERALQANPNAIEETYGIPDKDPYTILQKIALKRGWIYKTTKEPIIDEAAKAVIRDYHEGKLNFYITPPEQA
ncbi:MAG: GTP-binding protein [Thermoprotei archaeon]|nr:MAG: GTP-binding protein [Thermoprotei archaeon]